MKRQMLFLLVLMALVVPTVNAYLIDQVAIHAGEKINLKTSQGNYTITVTGLDDHVSFTVAKGEQYLNSVTLYPNQYYVVGGVKVEYVKVSGIDFFKFYGNGTVSVVNAEQSHQSQNTESKSINVTILPNPLIAGQGFVIMINGLKYGKVVMADSNGWTFTSGIEYGGIVRGKLPKNVASPVVIRVVDEDGNLVYATAVEVQQKAYKVSAMVVPNKPMAGGGLVVMFSQPITGTAYLIDSYTGDSNETQVVNGIATFHIPDYYVGPLILRVTDSSGEIIYQTVLQMASSSATVPSKKIHLAVNPTTVTVGQKFTVALSCNGKPVDGTIYVTDSAGTVIKTVETVNGRATISLDQTGTYTVYAKVGRAKTNSVQVTVKPKPLTVTVQTPNPKPNQPVAIAITKGATYTIFGPGMSAPITGTSNGIVTFTPPQSGTYTIEAELNGQTKTVTVNVKKSWTIYAYPPQPTLFGTVIKVQVEDSQGNPASGAITVRDPSGNAYQLPLVNGMAEIPVTASGQYVIMYQGASKTVVVRNSGNALPWLLVIAGLGCVGIFGYAWKNNKFGLKDKLKLSRVKEADVLE